MKIGDKVQLETGVSEVTRKVYDQSLKKTVFYAGEVRLTGKEELVHEEEERKYFYNNSWFRVHNYR